MAGKKDKFIAAAQKHLGKGNLEKAIQEYEFALAEDAGDMRLRHKMAELYARAGDLPKALQQFQAVADDHEKHGFLPRAQAIIKQMLKLDSLNVELLMKLGEMQHETGLFGDAKQHFEMASRAAESKGDLGQQLRVYQRLVELYPQATEHRLRLAEFNETHGDAANAAEIYRGLVPDLRTNRELDELQKVLERLATLEPNDLDAQKEVARLMLERGDAKRALSHLQVSFKANPQDIETLEMMGEAFTKTGKTEKAADAYREMARVAEQNGALAMRDKAVAQLQELEGPAEPPQDPPPAIPYSQETPADAQRAIMEAEVYVGYQMLDKARERLDAGLAEMPGCFQLHERMAHISVQLGEKLGAAERYLAMADIAMGVGDLGAVTMCISNARDLGSDNADLIARAGQREQLLAQARSAQEAQPAGGQYADPSEGPTQAIQAMMPPAQQQWSTPVEQAYQAPAPMSGGFASGEEAFRQGDIHLGAGRGEPAVEAFKQAIRAGYEVDLSMERIGLAFRTLGDWNAAVAQFKACLERGTLDRDAHLRVLFNMAATYEEKGDVRSAYSVYHQLYQADAGYSGGEVQRRLDALARQLGLVQ